MVISKMAAKMAAVTLNLAYLLNHLLQISREGDYHWVFWRHIYLYQIKVHILMMSSRNQDGCHFTSTGISSMVFNLVENMKR